MGEKDDGLPQDEHINEDKGLFDILLFIFISIELVTEKRQVRVISFLFTRSCWIAGSQYYKKL